jgi:hypothetical protein
VDLCRAWILRRAKDDKTFTSPLWFISCYFLNWPELRPLWRSVAMITFSYEFTFQQMKGFMNFREIRERHIILEPFRKAVTQCTAAMDTKGLLKHVKKMKENTFNISDKEELDNELFGMFDELSLQCKNVQNEAAIANEVCDLYLKSAVNGEK